MYFCVLILTVCFMKRYSDSIEYAKIADIALSTFTEFPISIHDFNSENLPFSHEVINYLISDGCLEQRDGYLTITYKGRMRVAGKGFAYDIRVKTFRNTVAIVGGFSAFITLLLYLIDKLFG